MIKNKNLVILLFIVILATFLRLWKIDKVPVSLFGDEVDVGYQAYSVLKTGKDYSGNILPIHFQSLAEWRTPLYLYSVVPTVALFGISPLGVRLPAAIFGILGVIVFYFLVKEMLSFENKPVTFHPRALLAAFILAINPWHIQYSRAGFEVTLLLLLLMTGLLFFFKSFRNSKFLIIASFLLALTPWVYSTAKLFTPLLLVFLFILFRKTILSISKKYLVLSFLVLLVVAAPISYSTFFGGGAQRFGYISVFTNPITEPEVGTSRLRDAQMRGELGTGLKPTLLDRVIHNKFTFWGENVIKNYIQAFSTEFLFIRGDTNPRHSIGIGEFYRIDAIILIIGILFFFRSGITNHTTDRRVKMLCLFWILAGAFPAAITRDGGNHATRLILILPPLILLIAYGLKELFDRSRLLFAIYSLLLLVSFSLYAHQYYVHYPWDSERWWHAGYQESFSYLKSVDKNYDKVVISMAGEPAWIFFAGFYQYPPAKWHTGYNPSWSDGPMKKTILEGFGQISYIDKYYFGSQNMKAGIYDLGKVIDKKTVYMAVAKEIGANLIMEPARTPPDLILLKAVAYPSGEPAFYIFTKK